ncbi:hypothetical protein B0I37DRAFT_413911 [Chaetomium sp. MPI-CAGE-AT-0009]|nr:hypothetical protein B0I37DRAFT_413911 [Chaetomium sp. MPI-CAGE-AT-0009]
MAKRRIHSHGDALHGSRGSKQQRMMTTANGGMGPETSEHPTQQRLISPQIKEGHRLLRLVLLQHIIRSPSTPQPESTKSKDQQLILSVGDLPFAFPRPNRPIVSQDLLIPRLNQDLTGSSPTSSSLPNKPTDSLNTTTSRSHRRGLFRKRGVQNIDGDQMTQVENDQRAAEILQQELYGELEGSSGEERLLRSLQFPRTVVDVDPFADLQKGLQSRRCLRCKTPLEIEGTALIQQTGEMFKRSRYLHPCAFCPKCKASSCIHCGGFYASRLPVLKHVVSGTGFKSTWCCDQGRLFLIFSFLCGLESTAPPSAKKTTKASHKEAPSGSAGHSQLSKGTGYGDGDSDYKPVISLALPTTPKNIDDDTGELALYFEALARLLPSTIQATTSFDRYPQPVVSEMIRRSPMFARASELLRHATIEEINQRCRPISAVLDFLTTVASHESTCLLLFQPRTLYPTAEQLPQIVLRTAKSSSRIQKLQNAAGVVKYETSESLAAVVEQLAVPVRKFVEASRRVGSLGVEYENGESLGVLKRICCMADDLERLRVQVPIESQQEPSSTPARHPTTNVSTRGARANAAKVAEAKATKDKATAASEWHRANCLKEIPDDVILNSFHFAPEARQAGKAKAAPGRMRKLLAQVSSLSTDLPDGIYVRHGESRVDVMKVLIIGPSDTPYENGLFEFDLFCGPEFPQRPPQMLFRTTGHGLARFNPNLYANGKICLSLLGTWRGQPWNPDRSTILQLLVSIQAMIFNDQPYYNEPGYELRSYPTQAQEYNRAIEALTVRYAMIPWLAERLVAPNKHTGATHTSQVNTQVKPDSQVLTQQTPSLPPSTTTASLLPSSLTPSWTWVQPTAQGYDPYMGADGLYLDLTPSYAHPTSSVSVQGQSETTMKTAEHYVAKLEHTPHGFAEAKEMLSYVYPPKAVGPPKTDNDKSMSVLRQPATASQQTLRSPREEDDPIFGAIIREHFRLKANVIVTTVQKWEKMAVKGGWLSKGVNTLEKLLNHHGFND